jgi:hypothetical protein
MLPSQHILEWECLVSTLALFEGSLGADRVNLLDSDGACRGKFKANTFSSSKLITLQTYLPLFMPPPQMRGGLNAAAGTEAAPAVPPA